MTGLNLETFLHLLRVAPGAWASLGVALFILALMTWTSWGSRRALRKCLFLSIGAHIVLIFYGGSSPEIQRYFRLGARAPRPEPSIPRIKVTPVEEPTRPSPDPTDPGKTAARPVSAWDRDAAAVALSEPGRAVARADRPEAPSLALPEAPHPADSIAAPAAAPELGVVDASTTESARRLADPAASLADPAAEVVAPGTGVAALGEPPPSATPAGSAPALGLASADLRGRARPRLDAEAEPAPAARRVPAAAGPTGGAVALPAAVPTAAAERDLIPPPSAPEPSERLAATAAVGPDAGAAAAAGELPLPTPDEPVPGPTTAVPAAPEPAAPGQILPDAGGRLLARSGVPAAGTDRSAAPRRSAAAARSGSDLGPASLARVTPAIAPALPSLPRATGRRPLAEVPSVYRSRLDPNRSSLAERAGASPASEQAVERALDWLARHQDADGRWDGGTVKFKDGHVADTDDTFLVHCPPGDVCYGECYYGEADTALTGLALLAYLGAGYTQTDGKYADVVGRGIGFLRQSQRPDGDLRGSSLAVGMYCHAMATLALCEAYALTGDPALRLPVERGVAFLTAGQARDGMAWRYEPGAPTGDTSILGWAVMALKSAKTVGIPIPATVQTGIAAWLNRVAAGSNGGLARYQPLAGVPVRPTMTAEAWACRQFLELGGPGPASDEAAASLLANPTDRGKFNVYYLYYSTLAMYQHGGAAWTAWNARVRDEVVGRQRTDGHKLGSWDPDDSPYGTHGGRIYCTALATLTLEVYYRFLRLYARAEPAATRPADPGARRAGLDLNLNLNPNPVRNPGPVPSRPAGPR